jgi:protoporphyrin/coproporphyrin ferrochelatase
MQSSFLPPHHPQARIGKIGVLLVNLGSPDAPTTAAVRRYLAQFLSDRRVIELHPLLWQPILRGIILNVRPKKSAAKYAAIWGDATLPAPLVRITAAQSAGLQAKFSADVIVDYAMRYGAPSIPSRLDDLMTVKGCDRILVVPMYPQYCAATTATVVDEVNRWLGARRWQPAVRVLPPYYDNPAYIDALAESVRTSLQSLPAPPEILLASFHGMPQETLTKGDPYHCHALKTGRVLREALGMTDKTFQITFQSRFLSKPWLQPYTDVTVATLAKSGVKRLAIVCPGFSADCLETLEEIVIEASATFRQNGGEAFDYLPCLNDSVAGMAMLEKLVRAELSGWI